MFEEFGTIVYLAKPLGRWYFKPGQVHSQIAYCLARIKKPKLIIDFAALYNVAVYSYVIKFGCKIMVIFRVTLRVQGK